MASRQNNKTPYLKRNCGSLCRLRLESIAIFLVFAGSIIVFEISGIRNRLEGDLHQNVIHGSYIEPSLFPILAALFGALLVNLLYMYRAAGHSEARRDDAENAAEQHKRRLEDFAQSTSEWLWETDVDGRFIYVSAKFEEVTGISQDQVIGRFRDDFSCLPGESSWQIERINDAMKARQPFQDATYQVATPAGRNLWVRTSGLPQFDDAGEFVGYRGTASDATSEHELRRSSEESHAHFLAALDALPASVLLYDTEGKLRSWNAAVGAYFRDVADQIVSGSTFQAFAATACERQAFLFTDAEEWVAARVRAYEEGRQDEIVQLRDGRWLQASHSRTTFGGAVTIWVDVTALVEREQALSRKTALLDAIMENMHQAVCVYDENRRLALWNTRFCELLKLPEEHAAVGQPMLDIVKHVFSKQMADPDAADRLANDIVQNGLEDVVERAMPDGSTVEIRTGTMPDGGQIKTFTDVTRRKAAELQLRQSQKMDAIGQLAGGMAHEFNNLLTAIGGFARMAQRKVEQPVFVADCLCEVVTAADHAAELTGQMLAYSRKQVSETRVVDVDHAVGGLAKLLQPLLGERVELEFALAGDGAHARVDPGQITQSIINLAINARDAMPEGGRLVIGTGLVTLPDDFSATHLGQSGGAYCSMYVKDTGTGINEDHLSRIFEPFFTTKEQGQGTGLGLAVVYGLMEQAGGMIDVRSTVGVGTIFTLYLPAVFEDVSERAMPNPDSDELAPKRATVLLVEDDDAVRRYVRMELESVGYDVITAVNGKNAIDEARSLGDRSIDILLSDVVMPVMGGVAAARVLTAERPDLKVVYMTGYPQRGAAAMDDFEDGATILYKPVTRNDLAHTLAAVLSGSAGPCPIGDEGVLVDV